MLTAVILTAYPREYQAILDQLSDTQEVVNSEGTVYEVGRFGAWRVALAETGPGYRIAALELIRAVRHFSPQVVLCVGLARGIRTVEGGDVVVVTRAQDYISHNNAYPSHRLVQRARAEDRKRWPTYPPSAPLPKVLFAPVLSLSTEIPEEKLRSVGEVVAIDETGFSFLRAARELSGTDVGLVRGISALVKDKTAVDVDKQVLAARNAATIAFAILEHLPTAAVLPSSKASKKRLYLERLQVQDARCFRTLDVSFTTDGEPRMLTQLVGRNGSGKTSFLRALALGLCQQKETSALLGKLVGDFIRQDKRGKKASEARIDVSLVDPTDPEVIYATRTFVTRDKSGQEIVRKETEPTDFPWSDIFVTGYGVNRGTGPGSPLPSEYRRSDAVASLFDDDVELVDAESVLRALKLSTYEGAGEALFSHIERHLKASLGLRPAHHLDVTSKQVLVRGPWGAMPLHALGDGYRGTLGWLLDLWGRSYLAGGLSNGGTLAGIVLIDEMDEHLHPSWQKS